MVGGRVSQLFSKYVCIIKRYKESVFEPKSSVFFSILRPFVTLETQGRINRYGGPVRKKCARPTYRIKVKGQMTVFCSIFVNY